METELSVYTNAEIFGEAALRAEILALKSKEED